MTNPEGRPPIRETLRILAQKARERAALVLSQAKAASSRGRGYYLSTAQPAAAREWRLFKNDLKVLQNRLGERISALRERRRFSTRPTRSRSLGGLIRGAFYLGVAGSVMLVI